MVHPWSENGVDKFSVTDFNSYGTVTIAADAPQRVDGRMQAAGRPSLGVTPDRAVLGDPVLEVR